MEEFKGYEIIQEGRPKLIKFTLKKNEVKWTMKDEDNNKVYYIRINEENPEENVHAFLTSICCYDEITMPRTDQLINYESMAKEVMEKGNITCWVPENRIHIIQSTWKYDPESLKEAPVAAYQKSLEIQSKITKLKQDGIKIRMEIEKLEKQRKSVLGEKKFLSFKQTLLGENKK